MEWSRITFYVFLGLADCSVLTGIYEEKEIHSMTFSASILKLETSLPSLSPRLRLISHYPLDWNPHKAQEAAAVAAHASPPHISFPVSFDLHVIDSGRSYPSSTRAMK